LIKLATLRPLLFKDLISPACGSRRYVEADRFSQTGHIDFETYFLRQFQEYRQMLFLLYFGEISGFEKKRFKTGVIEMSVEIAKLIAHGSRDPKIGRLGKLPN
jgi:hypothetical protein